MHFIPAFVAYVFKASAVLSSLTLDAFSLQLLRKRGFGSAQGLRGPITGFIILTFISFLAYLVIKSM